MPEFKLENGLVCYNWMPLVADHCIDYPPEFYVNWGVKRLHDKECFQPTDIDNIKENDIIFVKTDFIIHEEFKMLGTPTQTLLMFLIDLYHV